MVSLLFIGLAGSALAIEPSDLDYRIRLLTAKFEDMQARPETAIPPGVLENAKGIILLDRTKAGFLFAFEGGGGVAMVRVGKAGAWSPAAFMGASNVSLGFQVGAEQGFYAIVFMSTNATRLLTEPNYEYGSEARGTAGDASGGAHGELSPLKEHQVLVFTDRKGLYGGADLLAGGIVPDNKANAVYYGQSLTMADILFDHKVKATEPALALARALTDQAKPAIISSSRR